MRVLRWDAASHFLFMKSVYSSIFPLLCLSTPQKQKKWYDRHCETLCFFHTFNFSSDAPAVSVISKDVYCEWSSILWGSSVVRSVAVFAAARAIVSFRGKYIWISVRPVTDNEAKLYLDTFYFPPSSIIRQKSFYCTAFYPLLAILKQSFKIKRQKLDALLIFMLI